MASLSISVKPIPQKCATNMYLYNKYSISQIFALALFSDLIRTNHIFLVKI